MNPLAYIVAIWLHRKNADATRVRFWCDKYSLNTKHVEQLMSNLQRIKNPKANTVPIDPHVAFMQKTCQSIKDAGLKRMMRDLARTLH